MAFWEGYASDEVMGVVAPIATYWLYSGLYQLLGMASSPKRLDDFRMHMRAEEAKNLVTPRQVVKGVLLQQLLQACVAVPLFMLDPQAGKVSDSKPDLWQQAGQFGVAMLVMDTWQYFLHRLFHENKWLYRHLHSWHHRLIVPYAYGALYNHPVEGLIMDTVGGAISFLASGMSPRMAVYFFSFATMKTVDDHCGLWLPWNPFQLLFQNNTAYHDIHHQLLGTKYNFSQPFFVFWDRLMGTYMPVELAKRTSGAGYEARPVKLKVVQPVVSSEKSD
eukprot:SM000011S19165  [mRNA]  locus=s11:1232107:1234001:+ [translate_table: standard]